MHLDARHSQDCSPLFKEVLANKLNDPHFTPLSFVDPELHDDFAVAHNLSFVAMPGEVTPDFVFQKLNDFKTRMWKQEQGSGTSRNHNQLVAS